MIVVCTREFCEVEEGKGWVIGRGAELRYARHENPLGGRRGILRGFSNDLVQ